MLLDKRIKVLCFAPENTLKGLKWAFEQKVFTERSFELYAGSLSKVPENLNDFSLFFLTLDLAQPVPTENLKKLPRRPGVCAFIQPTPQQLLALAEVPEWNALAWDGISFERPAVKLDFLAERFADRQKIEQFVENAKVWLDHNLGTPALIEWGNPPEKWIGSLTFPFDAEKKSLSIGGQKSRADVKLPLRRENDEICEFRFHDGSWKMELFGRSEDVGFAGNPDSIRPGDQLQIENVILQVRASAETESFFGITRKLGMFPELGVVQLPDTTKTLSDVCRDLLSSWSTGELRITSGLKNGSIFFVDGTLQYAVCGAVSDKKALLRMCGWENPSWKFNPDRRSELHFSNMEMGFADFVQSYRAWQESWTKLRTFMPPPQIRLKASVKAFNAKARWTSEDYLVLSSVCEYRLIRDIFNNCPLTDVEILQSLVDMRKANLIEIQPASGTKI